MKIRPKGTEMFRVDIRTGKRRERQTWRSELSLFANLQHVS